MSDIFGSIGNMLGLSSTRDNGAAQAATDAANAGNTQLYGNWQNQNNANVGLSNQLANQNFYGNAQNTYQQQQNAANMLYNQATGQAQSAAQLQTQAGLANANQQTQSAALSNQGGLNPGAVQRNILNAQAMQNAQVLQAGMANRAAEQAQAQQTYANALYGMQGQQQSLGSLMYGQKANNLNYQTQAAANALQYGQGTNQANLGNTTGNINQTAQANAAQAAALGNTLTAAATGGASLMMPKAN